MSAASEAWGRALVAGLQAAPAFAGVDGLVREGAGLPAAKVEVIEGRDWSTKSETGREIVSQVRLRLAKGQTLRLPSMIAAAEAAGQALGGLIDGWRVGSAVHLTTRASETRDGERIAVVTHRGRLMREER